MLPSWYSVEPFSQYTNKNYLSREGIAAGRRKKNSKSTARAPVSKGRLFFAISMLVILSASAVYSINLQAARSPAPSHLPAPSLSSSTSPTVLVSPGNVSALTLGSTLTIQIKVQNMDQFNGWDIQVDTYSPIINATSLSITGNDFAVNASSGSAFEIVHCVNGKGTGCISTDGPGVVHSAYGNTGILTGNGLLFTITYKVTSNPTTCSCALWSPIALQNDLISSPSSGNGVPHISLSGSYGIYLISLGGGGDSPPRPT